MYHGGYFVCGMGGILYVMGGVFCMSADRFSDSPVMISLFHDPDRRSGRQFFKLKN